MPAIYGLDATLDLLESIGWNAIHSHVRRLGACLIDAVDNLGLDLITPRGWHAGIWNIRVPDPELARKQLSERGISVSARGQGIRVSPHFYNTEEDIALCIRALPEILSKRG